MGPIPNDKCPYKRQEKTQRRRPREDGGRYSSNSLVDTAKEYRSQVNTGEAKIGAKRNKQKTRRKTDFFKVFKRRMGPLAP